MIDLIILLAATLLGIFFFRTKGKGRGLTIQFPPVGQKGLKSRRNGYIVLVIMIGAIAFTQIRTHGKSWLGLAFIVLGSIIVVFFLSRIIKNKERPNRPNKT